MPTLHTTPYKAGTATYPGDCRHVVGEVMGPTTLGQHVIATSADYDDAADRTRVTFNHLELREDVPA